MRLTEFAEHAAETAALLRRLLDEVEAGRLDAPGSAGARLLRRLEGAATAFEVASECR